MHAIAPVLEFALAVAGTTVIHFLWQGAAIGILFEAVLGTLRDADPRLRERVAGLGVVCLVLVFAASGLRMGSESVEHGIALTMEAERLARGGAVLATAAAAPGPLSALASGVGAAWLLAAETLIAAIGYGWWQTRRLRARRAAPIEGPLAERCRDLARLMGVRGDIRLLASRTLEAPALAGWRSPAILLPARALLELPADTLESVIAHELAHVRRGDALMRVAQRMVRAVLFFQPATHRLLAAMDRERERCCDDLAVEACGSPARYARALARLERLRSRTPSLAMAADGAPLLARIRRLLEPRPAVRTRWRAFAGAGAMLAVAGGALLVILAPARALAPEARELIAALRSRHVSPHHPLAMDDGLRLRVRDVRRE